MENDNTSFFKEEWKNIEPNELPSWIDGDDSEIPFNEITDEKAKEMIENGSLQVLDVRFKWEYDHYHIPGSKLIPLPELEDRFYEIDPNKETLVVCEHGMRSSDACCLLNIKGMSFEKIFNLENGMSGYSGEVEGDLVRNNQLRK